MKKLIAAILSAVMLLLCIAGCSSPVLPSDTTAPEAITTTRESEESTGIMSDIETLTFDGADYNIWYSNKSTWSPYPLKVTEEEGNNGEIIYSSGFSRNAYLEEKHKVKLNYTVSATDPNNASSGDLSVLKILQSSGDAADYSLVFTGASAAASLALSGFYMDLSDSKYIAPEAEYYEKQVNSQIQLYGHQYFCSGYYSVMNTAAVDVTYVNYGIVEDINHVTLDDLYKLALNREWTIEKLLEYGKPYATVESNTGVTTDRYSLILSNNYRQNIFFDLGGKVVEYDAGENEYVPVIGEPSVTELLTKIAEMLDKNSGTAFVPNDRHAEFYLNQCAPFMIVTYNNLLKLKDSDLKYAMLPTPLIEVGRDYVAYSDAWNLNFAGIPAATSDKEMADYMFEVFMRASYEYVYPAYYQICFGTRYQPDSMGAQIFDILTHSRVIDFNNIYNLGINVQSLINVSAGTVSSTVKGMSKMLNTNLGKLKASYEAIK